MLIGRLLKPEAHAGIGPYVEVAFFHKPTRTLLTTDAVIFVPQRPPEVCPAQDFFFVILSFVIACSAPQASWQHAHKMPS